MIYGKFIEEPLVMPVFIELTSARAEIPKTVNSFHFNCIILRRLRDFLLEQIKPFVPTVLAIKQCVTEQANKKAGSETDWFPAPLFHCQVNLVFDTPHLGFLDSEVMILFYTVSLNFRIEC